MTRNDPPRRPGQHGTATRSRPPPTVSPHTLRGYGPCVLPDDGGGYGIGWQGWEQSMGGPGFAVLGRGTDAVLKIEHQYRLTEGGQWVLLHAVMVRVRRGWACREDEPGAGGRDHRG